MRVVGVALVGAIGLAAAPAYADAIVVGVPNWPSANVSANVIEQLLEARFKVEVEMKPMGTRELLSALNDGTVDIHPEVWLPNLDEAVERYAHDTRTVHLAPASASAEQHICTTAATVATTGIKALADLANPEMAAKFDTNADGIGEIWIGDDTWSSTRIERVRAKSYGYDRTMTLLTMPEEIAMAAVDAASATESPIVFYCYSPHYVFRLHDIVRLAEPPHDPQNWSLVADTTGNWLERSSAASAWEPSTLQVAFATSLAADHPDITRFLDHYGLTEQEAEAMSYAVDVEQRAPADVAAEWIAANAKRIEEWTK